MKRELKIFDSRRNVRILKIGFYAALGLLLIIDFFIHKHAEFAWEGYPNFFAAYGFISCLLLICLARGLGRLVRRDEDYYERTDEQGHPQ